MRRWILNIHLYGGLLCAPYLIIFGFSSLHFNHQFSFVKLTSTVVAWEAAWPIENGREAQATPDAVRDSIGLMGWALSARAKRDAAGNLDFDVERPGKSYTIHALAAEHRVRVEERRKGFWPVVISLHALMNLPNSSFVPFWGYYTEICTFFVIFAGASGVYLWLISRRERLIGFIMLAAAIAFSLGLMALVTLRG